MTTILTILGVFFLFSCKKDMTSSAPASGPADTSTRFELLSPERTGINFVQTITEEYRYNFSMDANIFNGPEHVLDSRRTQAICNCMKCHGYQLGAFWQAQRKTPSTSH